MSPGTSPPIWVMLSFTVQAGQTPHTRKRDADQTSRCGSHLETIQVSAGNDRVPLLSLVVGWGWQGDYHPELPDAIAETDIRSFIGWQATIVHSCPTYVSIAMPLMNITWKNDLTRSSGRSSSRWHSMVWWQPCRLIQSSMVQKEFNLHTDALNVGISTTTARWASQRESVP